MSYNPYRTPNSRPNRRRRRTVSQRTLNNFDNMILEDIPPSYDSLYAGGSGVAGGVASAGAVGANQVSQLRQAQSAVQPMLQMTEANAAAINIAEDIDMFAVGLGEEVVGSVVGTGIAATGGALIAGAVAGAALYEAGNALVNMFYQQNSTLSVMPLAGTFGGKLSTLRRKSNKGVRDKYEKKGAVYISETYGQVADPDQVMIGHSSFQINAVSYAVSMAMLRKLLRLGGFDAATPNAELQLEDLTNSGGGYVIRYSTMDGDGSVVPNAYTIPDNSTLETLALNTVFNLVYSAMTSQNPAVLQRIVFYKGDVLLSSLDMKREVLEVTCHSHTIVQNRTKTAEGTGSNSTTQVDAQPLKGPVFEFDGIPKTKAPYQNAVSSLDISGVFIQRAGNLVASDQIPWREPPTKKTFNNATKSGYTRVAPGQLKDMTISDHYRGYYGNLTSGRFRVITENNVVTHAPGRCQVAFLEEELNSGSNNNISIQYENQHTIGAHFITTKAPVMQPYYTSAIKNLVP